MISKPGLSEQYFITRSVCPLPYPYVNILTFELPLWIIGILCVYRLSLRNLWGQVTMCVPLWILRLEPLYIQININHDKHKDMFFVFLHAYMWAQSKPWENTAEVSALENLTSRHTLLVGVNSHFFNVHPEALRIYGSLTQEFQFWRLILRK